MAAPLLLAIHRAQLRRKDRIFRDRTNPLDDYDDVKLHKKFRFTRQQIFDITDAVKDEVDVASRKGALNASMQVLITLRFYATGSFQDVIGDLFGVSQATVGRVVDRVTTVLMQHVGDWIMFPDQAEADRQKQLFRKLARVGMPNIFGCIDGTQIPIQAPIHNEHEYVCRKNYHSINVQVVSNAQLLFINVVAKWPGSVHDSRILRESALFNAFEAFPRPLEGFLLGDSGYMMREWLLTPFANPETESEEIFNVSHMSTRNSVERAIGVAKRRWHCLRGLRLQPDKACQVITVCFMLSNMARLQNVHDDDSDESDFDDDSDKSGSEGDSASDSDSEHDVPDAPDNATERQRTAAGKAARQRVVSRFFCM